MEALSFPNEVCSFCYHFCWRAFGFLSNVMNKGMNRFLIGLSLLSGLFLSLIASLVLPLEEMSQHEGLCGLICATQNHS